VQDSVKCFAQVQVDDIRCSSIISQHCNPIVEGVLGSASTRLIFTRAQEGKQLGQLTQPGQTNKVFNTTCCHAGFRRGEAGQGEEELQLKSAWDIGR